MNAVTDLSSQKLAAQVLTDILHEKGIRHAYIGGFATRLLGGKRETNDIDIEIDATKETAYDLRNFDLPKQDPRFVSDQLKLCFALDDSVSGDDNVQEPVRKGVRIETLLAGTLGLPQNLVTIFPDDGSTIPILHPGMLVLTKIKRAAGYVGSTRPLSMFKLRSDLVDIVVQLKWLRDHGAKVDFEAYNHPRPGTLDDAVRKIVSDDQPSQDRETIKILPGLLRDTLRDEDWTRIFG